jgi:hypothetical protein
MVEVKTGRGQDIDIGHRLDGLNAAQNFLRGVFAFATWPPLAKFPRGNFLATI